MVASIAEERSGSPSRWELAGIAVAVALIQATRGGTWLKVAESAVAVVVVTAVETFALVRIRFGRKGEGV